MIRVVFLLMGSVFFLASCSPKLTPFTQRLYDQNEWTKSELKRIQFYLSDDVVLRREATGSKSKIEDGEIKIVEGGQLEKITIPKGTPGVFVFSPKEDRFAISFEDSDENYLMFGPNPKANYQYLLLASEWKKRGGIVTYGGKKYRVDNDNAYTTLMVDLRKVKKLSVKTRTVDGRRID